MTSKISDGTAERNCVREIAEPARKVWPGPVLPVFPVEVELCCRSRSESNRTSGPRTFHFPWCTPNVSSKDLGEWQSPQASRAAGKRHIQRRPIISENHGIARRLAGASVTHSGCVP